MLLDYGKNHDHNFLVYIENDYYLLWLLIDFENIVRLLNLLTMVVVTVHFLNLEIVIHNFDAYHNIILIWYIKCEKKFA